APRPNTSLYHDSGILRLAALVSNLGAGQTVERLQHGIAHGGGGDLGGAGGGDVAGADAGRQHVLGGLVDQVGVVGEGEGIAQHHGDAEEGGERIRQVLAGDIRGRAVHRLVEGAAAAGGVGGA